MISYAIGPVARTAYALRLRRGEHHRRDDVAYLRGQEVSVEGEEFSVSSDGELEGPLTRRSWHLQPGALHLVLPG